MLIGSRFRLQGREPATGLDCIGVLAAALRAIGRPTELPRTYHLKTLLPVGIGAIAGACGLQAAVGEIHPGDVLLVRISACQLHLLLALGPSAFVHAHAGLRRVVRHDGELGWPVIARWRLPEEEHP